MFLSTPFPWKHRKTKYFLMLLEIKGVNLEEIISIFDEVSSLVLSRNRFMFRSFRLQTDIERCLFKNSWLQKTLFLYRSYTNLRILKVVRRSSHLLWMSKLIIFFFLLLLVFSSSKSRNITNIRSTEGVDEPPFYQYPTSTIFQYFPVLWSIWHEMGQRFSK